MIDFTGKDDQQIYALISSQLHQLKNKRNPYEALWEILIKLFMPRRYDLLRNAQPGQQYGANVFDGHPQNAANKYAIGFLSYMVSKAVPWLQFVDRDQELMGNDDVKQYMQDATDQVLWSFNQSNFYGSSVWFSKDASVQGNGYSVPEENLITGNMTYKTIHPGECYVDDDRYGDPGVFMREVNLTAITQLQMFGKDKLTMSAKYNAENNPFVSDPFIFAVYKNPAQYEGSSRPEDKANKVFYVRKVNEPGVSPIAKQSGMDYFPMIWRPGKEPNQAYGMSLASDALTEGLQLNKLGEKTMEAAHLAVNPAYVASTALRNGLQGANLNRKAGGVSWVDNKNMRVSDLVHALNDRLNQPIGDAEREYLRHSLDDKFYIRFFEMLTARDLPGNITAFQINQMVSEKAVLMGAMVGGFESDYLAQSVEVQFNHETKAGRMPQAPDIMFTKKNPRTGKREETGKTDVDVSYVGPLSKLQKNTLETKPIVDGLGIISEITKIWPAAAVKVNEMELIEDAGIAFGWKQKHFKRDEEVRDILAADAAQQQKEQDMANAAEMAGKIPGLGKAVEPNSPLALVGA